MLLLLSLFDMINTFSIGSIHVVHFQLEKNFKVNCIEFQAFNSFVLPLPHFGVICLHVLIFNNAVAHKPFGALIRNLSSVLFSNRGIIQNLDHSNSSVCGEAAGEPLSTFFHFLCILIKPK